MGDRMRDRRNRKDGFGISRSGSNSNRGYQPQVSLRKLYIATAICVFIFFTVAIVFLR